jgi:hypothetical protein
VWEGLATATVLITFSLTPLTTSSALAVLALTGIHLYVRKRALASRIAILVASGACLLVLVLAIAGVRKHSSVALAPSHGAVTVSHSAMVIPAAAPSGTMLAASSASREAPRAVYGHSIVKGGIHSVGELLDVIATDPLAAQHYKGFDITRARFVRLDHNIMAYVSYRVDGKGIYWTAKPVLIMAGEEVITDGTNFIRVRCGNMIAFASQLPMEVEPATDTETIVETLSPLPEPRLMASLNATPIIPGGNSPSVTPPVVAPPANCCAYEGYYPPPIFEEPRTPNSPNTPPTPPNTVSINEFPRRGAFFTLLATILLLFLVERFRRL